MSEAINAVVVYQEPQRTSMQTKGKNYLAIVGAQSIELRRDVDFGKLPKCKQPTLFKPGAEKIIANYELLERYTMESAEENHDDKFYFYRFRCDLVKTIPYVHVETGIPGMFEVVVKSGWGSANCKESRCGFQGAYDAANGTLKMAKKRAMVDAAISIGRLSDMFTQDIENDEFMDNAKAELGTDSPDAPISAKQVKRIFSIANTNGISNERAKSIIGACGYVSSKDIKQRDYDKVCKAIEDAGKGESK